MKIRAILITFLLLGIWLLCLWVLTIHHPEGFNQ